MRTHAVRRWTADLEPTDEDLGRVEGEPRRGFGAAAMEAEVPAR
jgi:hypothetical protein